MLDLLHLAAYYALQKSDDDDRAFLLGSVGVRSDGRIVHSKNSASNNIIPEAHSEARLTKKLGFNATVYVARVSRGTKELAMARPCKSCQNILRSFRVKNVYYTISKNEYGMLNLATMVDTYY